MIFGGFMYGCGGICGRFNDGVCMGACSMDDKGRKDFVKRQVEQLKERKARQQASGERPSHVLKPLNPGAYDMFKKPTIPSKKEEKVSIASISHDEISELRQFRL